IPRQDLGRVLRGQGADAARQLWLDEPIFAEALATPTAARAVRTMVAEHSCALWRDPALGSYPEPDDVERLGDLRVPTLVVVGDRDVPGVAELDVRVAREVPGA